MVSVSFVYQYSSGGWTAVFFKAQYESYFQQFQLCPEGNVDIFVVFNTLSSLSQIPDCMVPLKINFVPATSCLVSHVTVIGDSH